MRPLVLLDVDGPLNPWAAHPKPAGYVAHEFKLGGWWSRTKQRVHLNPGHGPQLLAFAERTGAELAWATTWEHRANETVGPALGLPELKVIELAASTTWKYGPVARYAYDRPLAWLDDDFALHAEHNRRFRERRAGLVTRLIHVDPATGITSAHWEELDTFATALTT
jgi:hypothetical protein